MTKRSKWVRVALPSGGSAKVRSDVDAKTIEALDTVMQAAMRQYLAGELDVIGEQAHTYLTPEERRARAREFWGDSVGGALDTEQLVNGNGHALGGKEIEDSRQLAPE